MKKLSFSKLLLFTETLSALLKSGLPLQDSINVCSEIAGDIVLKSFCDNIHFQLDNGLSLSKVLKSYGKQIPSFYISLVEIGENIGSLQEVFEKLAGYYREKKHTCSKIYQALLYPLIVFITAIAVVCIIMFFVFPRLENIFEVFTENSSDIQQKVNSIKTCIYFSSVFFISSLLLFVSIIILHHFSSRIALYIDYVLFRIPFVSKCLQTVYSSDFSFAMKLLCSSGVTFSNALKQSECIVSNLYYQKELKNVRIKVEQGCEIEKVFSNRYIFPDYLTTWIKLTNKSGGIESVFAQIYEYYKNETSNIINSVVVSAEPFFILITGIIIFVLVLQFVVPVFSLLGAL